MSEHIKNSFDMKHVLQQIFTIDLSWFMLMAITWRIMYFSSHDKIIYKKNSLKKFLR